MNTNKIKHLLQKSQKYLDAEDISKKISGNVFEINSVLRRFEKRGLIVAR